MGKFLAALLSLVLGIALGAAGIPLALWVAMALYRAEIALEWAVWLIERSPLPLYAPAVQVANDAIRRDSLIAAGVAAAVLCLMAFSLLSFVRQALRSADESHDGKGTLELKTRPLRVGRPVEGNIWLTQGSAGGQSYRVELSCKRDHGSGRSEGSETPYVEELEVAPVRTPVGWSLPFRFVVPPIAPPSGAAYMSGPGYSWRLAFRRSKGWLAFPSVFTLNLAPAPPEALRPLEKRETPAQKYPIGEIVRGVGREPVLYEAPQLREPSTAYLETAAATGGTGDRQMRSRIAGEQKRDPGDFRGSDLAGDRGRRSSASDSGRIPKEDWGPYSASSAAPLAGFDRAADQGRVSDTDPQRLAGGHIPEGPRRAPNLLGDAAPGDARAYHRSTGASLAGTIVKWLFLVVFGGVLAVSAVALATAVLLRHIM